MKAKNENLESKLAVLRRKIEEQEKMNSSGIMNDMSTLIMEKKQLEELVTGMRTEQHQKAADGDVVKELKAQKAEMQEKLVRLSAELERYERAANNNSDAELTSLRNEKQHLETLVTHLENEVERHKDTAHEQRIRALDLTHELREVYFICCVFRHVTSCSFVIYFF